MVVSVYCAGGVKKGEQDEGKLIWGPEEQSALERGAAPIEVVFLSPNERADDVSDAFTVFGRDHYQVQVADYCVIDARQRRGIGVGIEMLSAKRFSKPLVVVAPPESHYRRARLVYLGGEVNDYVHAHMYGLADVIVDDFEQVGEWIRQYAGNPIPVKDASVVDDAIAEYRARQLQHDEPMRAVLTKLGRG